MSEVDLDVEPTEAMHHKVHSRRAFIKGIIAAGAAVSSANYLFRGGTAMFPTLASAQGVERLISLNINGTTRRVDVTRAETLAMTLRNKLGLTGTKIGCESRVR